MWNFEGLYFGSTALLPTLQLLASVDICCQGQVVVGMRVISCFGRNWQSNILLFCSVLPGCFKMRLKAAELVPPPIDNDLHAILSDMGATISGDGTVQTFGNDDESLEAAESSVAVVEMSHFGRLRVTGEDRIRFLHNQSTADFQSEKEGQGCDTVFVTPTGRTVDLVTAWIMKSSVILFVSPTMRHTLQALLNKYIFFADKVEVEDITDKTHFFSLIGPHSHRVLDKLNLGAIKDQPYGTHMHYAVSISLYSLLQNLWMRRKHQRFYTVTQIRRND
jgi:hypothetical protein